ncbi:MAG: glycoside hydrolase family 2 protein [Lachnospiraceae bacterium]|nr:glycoside hydrolase family 2 protein [Lachnospiraceae bacterium]
MSKRIYLNEDWEFCQEFREEYKDGNVEFEEGKIVRIPHTTKELPFHYFDESLYQMVSAYRKKVVIPTEAQGKRIYLTFEGAAHEATVYVNGEKVVQHECGYTAFGAEITKNINYGEENSILVRLDSNENLNIPPFGDSIDYMTYGGIYRDVYLDVKEKDNIEDVFVTTKVVGKEENSAFLKVDVTIDGVVEGAEIKAFLMRGERESELPFTAEKKENHIILTGDVHNILLWDVEHPNLYKLKVVLNGKEEAVVRFGFREITFLADGCYLNGKKIKIRGLDRHQSYPYVGYAMPKSMQQMDADILKYQLSCNAVRTSHYPQSRYFVDRCDEIGLLVFTEIPGWNYIGDESWKNIAVDTVKEMVMQYRNHPSIMLWGVRINESADDDEFYTRTNQVAHELDDSRMTGGVRVFRKSHLLEDVYTFNDFIHDGKEKGCREKKDVTPDMSKGYMVTEYNGHMFPTKMYDKEEERLEHALRHTRVLDAIASHDDIAGSFGWCMFDYNTHQDFGSGDRVCYHGVLDMFRNQKMAGNVYTSQGEANTFLDVSSTMDIGEHPASNRGEVYVFTNADSVKVYRNKKLIREYKGSESPFTHLAHGPILISDYVGEALVEEEHFSKGKADAVKDALNTAGIHGYRKFPPKPFWKFLNCVLFHHTSIKELETLYGKYIGDWGNEATVYTFEAIRDGKVVKTITKGPVKNISLSVDVSHTHLIEESTYDVAAVRLTAVDQYGNKLPFFMEPIKLKAEGEIELIGADVISLQGGSFGTYVKTTGRSGKGYLTLENSQMGRYTVEFQCDVNTKITRL